MSLIDPPAIKFFHAHYARCLVLMLSSALSVSSVYAQSTREEPLAEVNGEAITAKDLEDSLGARLAKLQEQIYELKRQELDGLIAQKLLGQETVKRNISVTALLDAEVTSKVGLVTEKEIEDFYQQNKARLPGDEQALREKIRAFLQQQKLASRRQAFVDSLRAQAKIINRLKPPPLLRVNLSVAGAPFRGAANAPVTIVEFSEFQCPFCHRVQATLKQLLERYPGKLKLVHRDFPLDSLHPLARRASEAARCAQDQGRFWEYHDTLFTHFPQATPNDLKEYAQKVGIDVNKFDSCLSDGVHKAAVQRDVEEGMRLGVTGTPAFFINGRPIQGAQPIEAFARVIDEELTALASK